MRKQSFDRIPKPEKKGNRVSAIVFIVLFIGILATMGVLFFLLPAQTQSEVEKRNLEEFPSFSDTSFWSGGFMKGVDLYIADHFPFRENLMQLSFALKEMRGHQNKEEAFYEASAPVEDIEEIQEVIADTATQLKPQEEFVEEKVEKNKGVLIYNGRALQIFGGNETMAKAYASAINAYYKELKGIVDIYVTVVPSAGEFYMPEKYAHLEGKEKTNIGQIYANLTPGIQGVDAHKLLFEHQDEYLYFRTDHHWTGLGAYYAYRAWCNAAGIKAMELSALEHKTIKGPFLGSLYHHTMDPRLAETPDTVHYWKVPGEQKTVKFKKQSQHKEEPGNLWVEFAKGVNSYAVFLGADWPLMISTTNVRNGRVALIVKNSYGNPFSTYFAAHFEKLIIMDYRYCERGVMSLIKEHKVTDLIFLNGAFTANTGYHIQRIRRVMYGTTGKVTFEKPQEDIKETIRDSTASSGEMDSIPNNMAPLLNDTIKQ